MKFSRTLVLSACALGISTAANAEGDFDVTSVHRIISTNVTGFVPGMGFPEQDNETLTSGVIGADFLESLSAIDSSGFEGDASAVVSGITENKRIRGYGITGAFTDAAPEGATILNEAFSRFDVRFRILEPTSVRFRATVEQISDGDVPFASASVFLISDAPGFEIMNIEVSDPGTDELFLETIFLPGNYQILADGASVFPAPLEFPGPDEQQAFWTIDLQVLPAGFCPGDCDGSGTVDFNDLVTMLFAFGDPGASVACDADASGAIDFNDLVAGLFLFGPCG